MPGAKGLLDMKTENSPSYFVTLRSLVSYKALGDGYQKFDFIQVKWKLDAD